MFELINKFIRQKIKINIFLKNKITTFKLILFGSSAPLFHTICWEFYYILSKIVYKKKLPNTQIIKQFKKKGFADIGKIKDNKLQKIKDIVDSKLNKQVPWQILKPEKNDELAYLLFDLFNEFSEEIKSVIGSEFQTLNIDAIKTMPYNTENKDSSFAWHLDDEPKKLIKLFLYLDDTTSENGAFRILSGKHSKKLFCSGFVSNTPRDRIMSQSLISKEYIQNSEWVERESGSLFCFDNSLIHKATYPLKGSRSILSINLCPSVNPLSLKNVEGSLKTPRVEHHPYPVYPWLNHYKN